MRRLWLDHLAEMLNEVDNPLCLNWDRVGIQRIFKLRRTSALTIMMAIDPKGLSEGCRQIKPDLLRKFLEEFREILDVATTEGSPRSKAIKKAEKYLRQKINSKVPDEKQKVAMENSNATSTMPCSVLKSAEVEEKTEITTHLLRTLTIEVDEKLAALLASQSEEHSTTPEYLASEVLAGWCQKYEAGGNDDLIRSSQEHEKATGRSETERNYHVALYLSKEGKKLFGELCQQQKDGKIQWGIVFKELAEQKLCRFGDKQFTSDRVHFDIMIPPQNKLSSIIEFIKFESVVTLKKQYGDQWKNLDGKIFWQPGFFLFIDDSNVSIVRDLILNLHQDLGEHIQVPKPPQGN